MATFEEYGASSYSRVPKLEYTNSHVEGEKIERTLITVADTSLSPNTVMVQFVDTLTTTAAVRHSWDFYKIAFLTVFNLQTRVRQVLFVAKLFYGTTSAHSLHIAPQTHKYVENADITHYLCPFICDQRIEVLYLSVNTCVYR